MNVFWGVANERFFVFLSIVDRSMICLLHGISINHFHTLQLNQKIQNTFFYFVDLILRMKVLKFSINLTDKRKKKLERTHLCILYNVIYFYAIQFLNLWVFTLKNTW